MKRRTLLAMMFAFAAVALMFGTTGSAQAQVIPCPPCPTYWVNYNYVYPPAPSGQFTLSVICADGRRFNTNETVDGHYTYPADPTCAARQLSVTWPGPPAGTVVVPIPTTGGPIFVPTPWGNLKIETKTNSSGCLEIDMSY